MGFIQGESNAMQQFGGDVQRIRNHRKTAGQVARSARRAQQRAEAKARKKALQAYRMQGGGY